MSRGYKLHAVIDAGRRLVAWDVRPMNENDKTVAMTMMHDLPGTGYLVGDAAYDASELYDQAAASTHQLVAALKPSHINKGYGRRSKSRHRRRCIDIITGGFGRQLLRDRRMIERFFGQLVSGPCGLSHLPPSVRSLRRVKQWVQGKLIIKHLLDHRRTAKSTA